ncbi:cryptochrome/photolyase family protein [Chitinophaga nivalis]|uniref:DNA photolyase family protein n=1 Tax=Chitinophaga nivalis TaxID=2991709 RepID=A0ABT3ISZ6_9BACT|nr:DNA photolyase family protein [Chitinophaga nivalis]MCW3487011.1 DNA photolyase family protein [Chitinophaga nivalis]
MMSPEISGQQACIGCLMAAIINMSVVNLIWFRRDLRLEDQAALYHALKAEHPVVPVFVLDKAILDDLADNTDKRVAFIYGALEVMQQQLLQLGSSLDVFYGTPAAAFAHWTAKYQVAKVFTNHDYEPYARQRDAAIAQQLREQGISFHMGKDQVILEKNEVLKDNGEPYTVFTPYHKKWQQVLQPAHLQSYACSQYFSKFYQQAPVKIPTPEEIGFKVIPLPFPDREMNIQVIRHYDETRDYPALEGTSRLGVHLRFGTVSIREVMQTALQLNATFAKELVWREFYQMILWHFPAVATHSFRPAYDRIQWRNNETEFERWCQGMTGYPIVDAGMRELNATGYMHNRVRMITASFLTKHLLVDWRWGEAYFAEKLLDYDLAANNGGWQWAAGTGCDAAPYFRVFNPALQTQKFDKQLDYIRKWVPELDGFDYVQPIVSHEAARKRALEVYGRALKEK